MEQNKQLNSTNHCQAENNVKQPKKQQVNPANENIINISLPTHESFEPRQNQGIQQIKIDPQPIKLYIDNSTDWPTVLVGFGSILTAGIVGWLTHINQKRQVEAQQHQTKATAATFRADWQASLRNAIARFLSIVALIKFEMDSDATYLNKQSSNEQYSSLIESQVSIGLLLDPEKKQSDEIKNLISEIIKDLKNKNTSQINSNINKLAEISADLLEKAWQDIQKDLYK